MSRVSQVTSTSTGIFDAREWIKEGDGLLASSRTMRATWLIKRRQFSGTIKARRQGNAVPRPWNELVGMPRASMLLLGYAVEMYLKAGVVKAYVGCREGMLERDLKKRYGHGLAEIAAEIDFPETAVRKREFDALRRMILFDSRYPITPGPGGNYHAEVNERTQRVWSSSDFASMSRLARRVREHVSRIDGDSNYPGSHHSYRIDDDGYLALRVGGHLRPRITFRFSSEQHRSGGRNLEPYAPNLCEGRVPADHALVGRR